MRENSVSGEECVKNQPLVETHKILLSLRHIKLGLMKNFFQAMNNMVRVLSM
jgi:hypothetical protein